MRDLQIILKNEPGELARMGEILGQAQVSLEGGGVFVHDNRGLAHFLVEDAEKGKDALEAQGIQVEKINEVLIQKLNQGVPGQLGKISRLMAENGVNILTQYSDHDNQLILVVDDYEKGKVISDKWKNGDYEEKPGNG
ncbi:MAG: amino acid-binding ACT domain-containing protein [Bacteroidota bacterium]